MKTLCAIGPDSRLPSDEVFAKLTTLAWDHLFAEEPDVLITGLNPGFEQAVAMAALDLGIEVHVFTDQVGKADGWSKPAVERYLGILERCALKRNFNLRGPCIEATRRRDAEMIAACDSVLALWDGSYNETLDLAEMEGRDVVNLWDAWNS